MVRAVLGLDAFMVFTSDNAMIHQLTCKIKRKTPRITEKMNYVKKFHAKKRGPANEPALLAEVSRRC